MIYCFTRNGTALREVLFLNTSQRSVFNLNSIEDRFEFWVRYDMYSLFGEVVCFFSAGYALGSMIPSLWVSIWYEYINECISVNT